MPNESYLDYLKITPRYIHSLIDDKSNKNDLTCLIPKNDQSTPSILQEHGFRYAGKRLVEGRIMVVYKWFRELDGVYEDMRSFFNRRVHDYDLHMRDGYDNYDTYFISLLKDIPYTNDDISILDLGCGTGAELKYIFQKAPKAHIVCIDVAEEMLQKLQDIYRDFSNNIEIIYSSYLLADFGEKCYDYVVACSTLHHILPEDKLNLYMRIKKGLRDNGYLLIQDYVANSIQEEESLRTKYLELINGGVIDKNEIYHIDLPLTMDHEEDLLKAAGFKVVKSQRVGDNGVIISARS